MTFNIENYHELLRSYYDNKHKFLVSNFIQEMHPTKPTVNTYALLLSCVCQVKLYENVYMVVEILFCFNHNPVKLHIIRKNKVRELSQQNAMTKFIKMVLLALLYKSVRRK